MKRKIALAFLTFLLVAMAGALALLSTPWAGRKLCDLATEQARSAAGVEVSFGACRILPLRLSVHLDEVRVGPADRPMFAADALEARLAPLQALSRRIHVDNLSVVRPRVSLVLPPSDPAAPPAPCPPPILQQLHVRRLQVDDGSVDVTLPGGEQIIVGRVDVHTTSEWLPTDLAALARGGRRSRVDVTLGPTLVEAGGRQTLLDQGFVEADVAYDLSRLLVRDFRVEGEGVKVSARGSISDLCKPRLGMEVNAQAPLPAIFALARVRGWRSDGSASVQLRLSGPVETLDATADVQLKGARIGPYVPGDARVQARLQGTRLEVTRLEVPFSGGATITGKATIQLAGKPTVSATADVSKVEFAELLDRLGLDAARVMMKLDAHVEVEGPLSPLRLAGNAVVDAADFRVLDRRWERWRPGGSTVLDLPRGHVEAPVIITADGVEIREGGRVRAGEETLGVTGHVYFADEGGFDLALDGTADLTALRHVATVPFSGKASFQGTVKAAPYGPPNVNGEVRARDFHFLDLDLGEVSGRVQATPDLVLRLRDGVGRKGESRYTVETTVDLGATPIRILPSRATAQGRLHDLFDVVIPWLPATRLFQEAIDGSAQLEMPFEGPVPKVNMAFRGTLGRGTLWERGFDWGRVEARVIDGERAVVDGAELHLGTGVATGGGTLEFGGDTPWDMHVDVEGLELAGLDLPGDGWGGTVRGRATFGRSVENPLVRFEGSGDGVVAGAGVRLGLVDVRGEMHGRDLQLAATTPGITLAAHLQVRGDMPYQATAEIDAEDLYRLFPGGPPAGLRAQARGKATARGTLSSFLSSEARLDLSLFRVGYSDFRVQNRLPVALSVARRRMSVESLTLQGTNTSFAVQGTREADGELDFQAQGTLDLRLLGGLVPAITRTHGTLSLDARVTRTMDEPLIVGSGRLADGGFRVRELPLEFAALAGDLVFSQNLVVFERIDGTLNGAPTRLAGEVALSRFVPTSIRVTGDMDRVPVAIPSWLPTVLSGKLEAYGTPDAMTLAGTLHVVSARYTENFELDKRILQIGGPKAVAPRPYDPTQEWLRFDLRFLVDGDCRIDNDLVRGQARGDLVLTGSLAGFGMTGSLAFLPGGRAFYRGTEFVLSRAVVDYTDRTRIRMVLDVTGEAQVSEYRIYLHLHGDLDDPRLQLTSTPTLSQQDIITLLSMGYTSRDLNVGGGGIGTVATAAAAQALFTVSGLDQQLRRFLPAGGVFQDFSVRLTSGYSKTSMTVEPRWEFETKALESRLRIRYQAPLSSSTRGQKAQVEYRLGDRASVQFQWDNDNVDVSGGDLGADFKLRWEWND